MTPPTARQLIDAWERAQTAPAVKRPAVLLAAAAGEPLAATTEWEQLPLGRRDAQLLALREQTFGNQLHCLADCPECRTAVEFSLTSSELQFPAPDNQGPFELTRDGLTLSFRLPNSVDLAAAAAAPDVAGARRLLFARCLVAATQADGGLVAPDDVPDELVRAVGDGMVAADAQADLTFALRCPQCEAAWEAPFDVAAFFWQELQVWVKRVLREVHDLASAYGWSETEILALSSARRHAYLELIRA